MQRNRPSSLDIAARQKLGSVFGRATALPSSGLRTTPLAQRMSAAAGLEAHR